MGSARAAGARPWRDARPERESTRPTRDVSHPEPSEPEVIALAVTEAFVATFPALARAAPERVENFQIAVERALRGRPGRGKPGRPRRKSA